MTEQYQRLIIPKLKELLATQSSQDILIFIEEHLLDITIAAEHPDFEISLILGFLDSRQLTPDILHAIVEVLNKAQNLESCHPAIKSWTIPVFSSAYLISSYLLDSQDNSSSSLNLPLPSIFDSTLMNHGASLVSIFQTYRLRGVVTWPLLEYLFPTLSERLSMLISNGYRSKGILVLVLYLRLFYSREEFFRLLRELSPLLLSLSFEEIMMISGSRFLVCNPIEDKLFLIFTEELLWIPAEPCTREVLVILVLLEHCPNDLKQAYEVQLLSACRRLLAEGRSLEGSLDSELDSEELLVSLWAEARGCTITSQKSKQQIPQPLRLICAQAAQARRVIVRKKPSSVIPRIALCVSGQLRSWKESVLNWADVLYPHANIDTYVHTWSTAGQRSSIFSRSLPAGITKTLRQLSLDKEGSSLIRDYPSIQGLLSFDLQAPDANEIASIYNTSVDRIVIEDDALPPYSSMSNSQKMLHKIRSCHQLMERNGKRYDLVIRIRPDFSLTPATWFSWSDAYQQLVSSFRIGLADSSLTTTSISFFANDTFAIGTPEVMALYARCLDISLFAQKDKVLWSSNDSSHAVLGWGLWLLGIKATPVSGLHGKIIKDSSPLDLCELRKAVVRDSLGRMTEKDKTLLLAIDRELAGRI